MKESNLRYIYGPVYSWRLGLSLGIDPLSDKSKICNFDCVYCQLGKTVHLSNERKVYVPTQDILKDFELLPEQTYDHITFSGRGEPTLAANLGDMIRAVRDIRPEKIAVITNSGLIDRPEVRTDLCLADFVLIKLDAADQTSFDHVDKAVSGIGFSSMLEGIQIFREEFQGRLGLQLMFLPENRDCAAQMAGIARQIRADEIELNTPLRPSAAQPLSAGDMQEIKRFFDGLPAKTVYEVPHRTFQPLNERDTVKRHGNYKKERRPVL